MENNTAFSESFLLGVIAAFGGIITIVFASVRKSRCTSLRCCGMQCTRDVMSEQAVLNEIKVENENNNVDNT